MSAERIGHLKTFDKDNDALRAKFQRLHTDIIGLNLSSAIDALFSQSVLSADDMLDLELEQSARRRTARLLLILHRSGHPQAFVRLREAICGEPAYGFFVEKLDGLRLEDDDECDAVKCSDRDVADVGVSVTTSRVCRVDVQRTGTTSDGTNVGEMGAGRIPATSCSPSGSAPGGKKKGPKLDFKGRSLQRSDALDVDEIDEIDGHQRPATAAAVAGDEFSAYPIPNMMSKPRRSVSLFQPITLPIACDANANSRRREDADEASRHASTRCCSGREIPFNGGHRYPVDNPSEKDEHAARLQHQLELDGSQDSVVSLVSGKSFCAAYPPPPAMTSSGDADSGEEGGATTGKPRRKNAVRVRHAKNSSPSISSSSSLLACMSHGQPIFGIASLHTHLYLVRQHGIELEKYAIKPSVADDDFFQFCSSIPLPGLRNPNDLAACRLTDNIYVLDCLLPNSFVYRYSTTGASLIDRWPTGDQTAVKVSITRSGSVLLVYPGVRKVREFSPDGRPLSEVDLSPEIVNPWHAIRLEDSSLLVCHGDSVDRLHRVCLLQFSGCGETGKDNRAAQLSKSYGGFKGPSDRGLLSVPSHMTATSEKRGLVYAADVNNGRVVVLDFGLRHVRDFTVQDSIIRYVSTSSSSSPDPSERTARWYPIRVCLDEPSGLLFVSCVERDGRRWIVGRVAVFRAF